MDVPKIVVGLNFTVEARCPHCQNLNKYQQLNSVHSNIKRHLMKLDAEKPADWAVDAKCQSCDKWTRIVKTVFM